MRAITVLILPKEGDTEKDIVKVFEGLTEQMKEEWRWEGCSFDLPNGDIQIYE